MMKICNAMAIPLSALLLLAAGCETISGSQPRRQEADTAALRASFERQQMARDVEIARSSAQSLEVRADQLDSRLARMEGAQGLHASSAEVAALRRDVESLRSEIAAVKADREVMKKEIIDQISSDVASLLARQAAQTRTRTQEQSQSGYEHKVQSGQTLSAIAVAYGVSVERIKKANNLTSDVIRVGQTLFIPD